MAEIVILHYHPGNSVLHRIDPRFKVLLMVMYIAVLLSGHWVHWSVITLLLAIGSFSSGLRPRTFHRELKVFAVLSFVIALSHFLNSLDMGIGQSLMEAFFSAWRFILIVWFGILFTAVTEPVELHAVVYWLLRPIPGIPAGRLAAHSSLSIVIIPLLLDGVHEIREAGKARGIERCKNPVRRLRSILNPLMEKLLLQMEELALALEARNFDESVVHTNLKLKSADVLYSLLIAFPLVALQIIDIYL
mgnify:CR=1 FL=1